MEETRSIERGRRYFRKPVPEREWRPDEIAAVRSALAGFHYRDGSAVCADEELVARLLERAQFYAKNPFELSALLYRKSCDLQEKPHWWPETPHWFVHVVDRAYARDWISRHAPAARPPAKASGETGPAYPEDVVTKAECEALISQMASRKGFPT